MTRTVTTRIPGDTFTPVGMYLRLRDVFPHAMLLECTDYSSRENAFSYIAIQPFAGIKATESTFSRKAITGQQSAVTMTSPMEIPELTDQFLEELKASGLKTSQLMPGVFGYTSYDAINAFDNVEIESPGTEGSGQIPLLKYDLYRVVIAFNHFNSTISLTEIISGNEEPITPRVISILANRNNTFFPFQAVGNERIITGDKEFKKQVEQGIEHCQRGDVFQIVLSRKYEQDFTGDEFNVYRTLRSINPSPYLFYFDFLDFKLFGSSPEVQLHVGNGKAMINPIAGTVVRTGDAASDTELIADLLDNPKENSEHAMLVDLARNDLSRHAGNVKVNKFREVHTYSHVIHLVSTVEGDLEKEGNLFRLFADTFPAGTLSGAPKHRAIQLIDQIEQKPRGFYGGAVGIMGFGDSLNHAIMIRSFMSRNGTLYYQAGAGVVIHSKPDGELKEVDGKISALRKAVAGAEKIPLSRFALNPEVQ
ncbi:MAG: anthranilate synthase component I family protein [Bacteroidetes bacterium]|nr:MAG: anthranilate synthase component I family protein [Bacteroidota bacterium]